MRNAAPYDAAAETTPFTVAALGTSLTARGGWLEPLAAWLQERLGRPVRALNFGLPGVSSRRGLARLDALIAARPDLVLIEFSINDAALHRLVPLDRSIANAGLMLARIRQRLPGARAYLMTMNPALGIRALLRPRLERYYEAYRRLATRERAGLIDIRASWATLDPDTLRRALPDGGHPSPEFVHRVILPTIQRSLEAALPPRWPPPGRPPRA